MLHSKVNAILVLAPSFADFVITKSVEGPHKTATVFPQEKLKSPAWVMKVTLVEGSTTFSVSSHLRKKTPVPEKLIETSSQHLLCLIFQIPAGLSVQNRLQDSTSLADFSPFMSPAKHNRATCSYTKYK